MNVSQNGLYRREKGGGGRGKEGGGGRRDQGEGRRRGEEAGKRRRGGRIRREEEVSPEAGQSLLVSFFVAPVPPLQVCAGVMEASELQKQVPAAAIMALPASGTHLASNHPRDCWTSFWNVPQQLGSAWVHTCPPPNPLTWMVEDGLQRWPRGVAYPRVEGRGEGEARPHRVLEMKRRTLGRGLWFGEQVTTVCVCVCLCTRVCTSL